MRRHIPAPSLSVDRQPVALGQQAIPFVVENFVGMDIHDEPSPGVACHVGSHRHTVDDNVVARAIHAGPTRAGCASRREWARRKEGTATKRCAAKGRSSTRRTPSSRTTAASSCSAAACAPASRSGTARHASASPCDSADGGSTASCDATAACGTACAPNRSESRTRASPRHTPGCSKATNASRCRTDASAAEGRAASGRGKAGSGGSCPGRETASHVPRNTACQRSAKFDAS